MPRLLAQAFPDLDLLDPELPPVAALEQRALRAEAAGLAVKGVSKSGGASASAGIGGMVLVTSHGFRGAYLGSRSRRLRCRRSPAKAPPWSATTISPRALHAADLDAPEKIGRTAGERAVERLNPRKVETTQVPVVFDPRVASSLVGHLASAINGSAIARKTSFLKDKLGERLFRPGIRIIDDPLRKRGLRSRPFDGEGVAGKPLAVIEDGVLDVLVSRLRDRARARPRHHRPRAARRLVGAVAGRRPICISKPGTQSPDELIADIADGFYVTDLIGMGVNQVTGDYSRGASGFWIENGELTYPVSEVTIAGQSHRHVRVLTPANDLEFRYGTNAPTVRLEGLTVAGR